MNISVTVFLFLFVCVCVIMVMDFSAEDNANGVIFCAAVHRRPMQGISHFGNFARPEAQNWPPNRPAHTLNYKQNWKKPSLQP